MGICILCHGRCRGNIHRDGGCNLSPKTKKRRKSRKKNVEHVERGAPIGGTRKKSASSKETGKKKKKKEG